MKKVLFCDRLSVHPELHIVECMLCDYWADYLLNDWQDRQSFGNRESAYLSAGSHAWAKHHGGARIVQAVRP